MYTIRKNASKCGWVFHQKSKKDHLRPPLKFKFQKFSNVAWWVNVKGCNASVWPCFYPWDILCFLISLLINSGCFQLVHISPTSCVSCGERHHQKKPKRYVARHKKGWPHCPCNEAMINALGVAWVRWMYIMSDSTCRRLIHAKIGVFNLGDLLRMWNSQSIFKKVENPALRNKWLLEY